MAKKFNFRLEPVLKLKTHNVSMAKNALNQVAKIRADKDKSISNNKDYREELMKLEMSAIKASDFQNNYHHRKHVERIIEKLEQERQQLMEIEELRRKKLSEAMKEEKVLDKLKEKKKITHSEEILKEENHFFDEIAINNHFKSKDK